MERSDEVTECKKIDVFGDGRCVLIQADVVEGLRGLPPESVHCIITSPPYYGLRDYGTATWEGGDAACDHKVGRFETKTPVSDKQLSNAGSAGHRAHSVCSKCGARRIDAQLGLEATPAEYVEKMVEVFREVRRVLREDGMLWLNLGASYAASRPAKSEVACGSGDIGPQDLQETGPACSRSGGERQGGSRTRRGRTSRSETTPAELPLPHEMKDRDSGPADSVQVGGRTSPSGVPVSTNPSSTSRVQGASFPEATASPFPQGSCSVCDDVPATVHMSACTPDTVRPRPTSDARTSGKEPLHTASPTSYQEPAALTLLYSTIKALIVKPKNLIMMPSLVAMALQADGWWLRAACPWLKRNAMPGSEKDRPPSAVEYVFLLTKKARYYYDQEAVKVPGAGVSGGACFGKQSGDPAQTLAQQRRYNRPEYTTRARRASDWFFESWQGLYDEGDGPLAFIVNPAPFDAEFCTACERYFTGAGKKAIRIEKYTEDGREKIRSWCPCGRQDAWVSHFATFPPGLVKPCIKAGTSQKGCCPKCGAPWRRVAERKGGTTGKSWHDHEADSERGMSQGSHPGGAGNATDGDGEGYSTRTLGWSPTCACGLEPAPCTVLDPFGGAGTVSLVAEGLGRRSIYIDLNANYLKMAAERIKKDARLLTARSDASDDGEMPLLAGLDEPIKETARGRDKQMLGSASA